MKLIFGERNAALAEARQLADFARRVERCRLTMLRGEGKCPRRDLVKKYGREAVEECERRIGEAK